MLAKLLCAGALAAILAPYPALAQDAQRLTLTGWGIDEKNPEAFIAAAADAGFDALITWNTSPAVLARDVAAGQAHHVKVFSCISPMGALANLWKKQYPDRPVPWQVMSEDEEAARRFLAAGRNQYLIPYQFGGEPLLTNEVLTTPIICLSNLDARELFKPLIDQILAVPGIAGLAFDGFGYQNYHCCRCEHCTALLADFRTAHPELSAEDAEVAFFRGTLVDTINSLADYARSRKPDAETTIHVWPVYAPDPLYGNLLDLDECGQTAAWYTLWPEDKIARYSQIISGEAKRYFARQEGVGMIGYYDRPGQFPVKDAARVEMELRTMIANGCKNVQVCSTVDVLKNPQVTAVFRKCFQ